MMIVGALWVFLDVAHIFFTNMMLYWDMNLNANFLFENFNDVGSSIQCIMMNEIVEALAGL